MSPGLGIRGIALALSAFSTCSFGTGASFDKPAMLSHLVTTVALPSYGAFVTEADALLLSAESLCEAPDADRVMTMREALDRAAIAFEHTRAFGFGPHLDPPLRLGPKVSDWPVSEQAVDQLLEGDLAVDRASLAGYGSVHTGLPPLGHLLHREPDAAALAVTLESDTRQCAYIVGLSGHLVDRAEAYVNAWSPEGDDYGGALAEGRDPFMDDFEAAAMLFQQQLDTLADIRHTRLGKPLGRERGGEPALDTLQSRPSGRSLEDARAAFDGVVRVWRGGIETDGNGLREWLRSRNGVLVAAVQADFEAAEAAFVALEGDTLANRIIDDNDAVNALYDRLLVLEQRLAMEVASALAITATFSPVDGD